MTSYLDRKLWRDLNRMKGQAAAVALVHGAAGEAQFADAVVRDPRVIAVRDRVSVAASASVRKLEAHVTIRLRNGTLLEKHVEHALGTVERPMSDRDLEEKFLNLTDGVLVPDAARRVIDLSWRVGELEDAGELSRATVPS